jgi:hypothetical protein
VLRVGHLAVDDDISERSDGLVHQPLWLRFVRGSMNGRPQRITLGLYGDLTVKQARTLGQEKAGDKNAELGDKAGVLWSTDSNWKATEV